jgi:hypothetical protein
MKYDALGNRSMKVMLKKRQEEIYYYPKCFLKLMKNIKEKQR